MAKERLGDFRPWQITLSHSAFRDIQAWSFPARPFYIGLIPRLLGNDIVARARYSAFMFWIYRNQEKHIVGFGSIDICEDYRQFTAGLAHAYIPLLAVHPDFQGRGYGGRIVDHLVSVARSCIKNNLGEISNIIFLDVYLKNEPAIALYQKHGFEILNRDDPIPDPAEGNEPYVIMARRLS